MLQEVPCDLLEQWSEATQLEEHLASESIESLKSNLKMAVIALESGLAVGFAGLIEARTPDGYGLLWRGRQVIELGGAYINPAWRGSGIWRRLVELRIEYATTQPWCVVCVTGNPIVQRGLQQFGSVPIAQPALRRQLCLGCEAGCSYCPLAEGNAWMVT